MFLIDNLIVLNFTKLLTQEKSGVSKAEGDQSSLNLTSLSNGGQSMPGQNPADARMHFAEDLL